MAAKFDYETKAGNGGETYQQVPAKGPHDGDGHLTTNQGIRLYAIWSSPTRPHCLSLGRILSLAFKLARSASNRSTTLVSWGSATLAACGPSSCSSSAPSEPLHSDRRAALVRRAFRLFDDLRLST